LTTSAVMTLVVPIARSTNRWTAVEFSACRDVYVDDLPYLVDGAVDVAPPASHLHVRLVHLPAIADSMPARSAGLGQQRRKQYYLAVSGNGKR
jgi:hypothetical protein